MEFSPWALERPGFAGTIEWGWTGFDGGSEVPVAGRGVWTSTKLCKNHNCQQQCDQGGLRSQERCSPRLSGL